MYPAKDFGVIYPPEDEDAALRNVIYKDALWESMSSKWRSLTKIDAYELKRIASVAWLTHEDVEENELAKLYDEYLFIRKLKE
tara:strand:- start:872 stop:1120 length:249 start_codon:yes stop_codon:yes gene_type:complete